MAIRERFPHPTSTHSDQEPDLLIHRVERMVAALTRYTRAAAERGPDHPCFEDHVHDIPLSEWRMMIDAWCRADVVREEHGRDMVDGLRIALSHFDDDELRDFVLRLV